MKPHTTATIRNAKGKTRLSMITAYDALMARLFAGKTDMILVGDSLSMSFGGQKDTLAADMEVMLYHTKAVCAGAPESFVVLDMPFGTYPDEKSALENAVRVYRETGAAAVKIEGGVEKAGIIRHLTQNSVAVMGHVGLLPQYVRSEGGYKIKGKDDAQTARLVEDAKAVEAAGAFAMVLEGTKPDAARAVAEAVKVPVIGIGAGPYVDGQVLVWSDMLGLFEGFTPKFVRKYMDGAALVKEAVERYDRDVKEGTFPGADESY